MKPADLLRMWLSENAESLRAREANARKSYLPGSLMGKACEALADCHAAAALIYETELSKLGPEEP